MHIHEPDHAGKHLQVQSLLLKIPFLQFNSSSQLIGFDVVTIESVVLLEQLVFIRVDSTSYPQTDGQTNFTSEFEQFDLSKSLQKKLFSFWQSKIVHTQNNKILKHNINSLIFILTWPIPNWKAYTRTGDVVKNSVIFTI